MMTVDDLNAAATWPEPQHEGLVALSTSNLIKPAPSSPASMASSLRSTPSSLSETSAKLRDFEHAAWPLEGSFGTNYLRPVNQAMHFVQARRARKHEDSEQAGLSEHYAVIWLKAPSSH
jgi:hypothetical protein